MHHYAHEKLTNAVYCMVTGPGSIKDRLHDAFLEIVALSERDFPDDLKEEYRWIRYRAHEAGGETACLG